MGDIADAGRVQNPGTVPQDRPGGRRNNWRTAMVLSSIALVFFVGVIVNRLVFN